MKRINPICAFLLSFFLFCSCQNEEEVSVTHSVFTATIEDGGTRTTLGGEGNKEVMWSEGDQISVNGVTYQTTSNTSTADFTLPGGNDAQKDVEGNYKAYFPASMYNSGLPASYTYAEGKFNMPMYAVSTTKQLQFKNICAVLAIKVSSSEMSSVSSIEVSSSNQRMNGAFTCTSDGVLAFSSEPSTDADKKVTLTFSSAQTISAITTFYLPIAPATHGMLTIKVSDGTTTKVMKTKAQSITVVRNKIYPITFADNCSDPNLLPGEFSVSATKKVRFSKGNLYWDGSAFQFEEHQYDYPTSWNANHVGHFYWTVDVKNGYAESASESTTTTDVPFFAESRKNEWNVAGQTGYYTVTKEEVQYLASTRDNAANLKKEGVTVGGVTYCLVLAPDGYTGTIADSYDATTWAAAEKLGLICMTRSCRTSSGVQKGYGYYWTSTHCASSKKAYAMKIGNGSDTNKLSIDEKDTDWYAYSIRLVKTVE